MYVFVLSQREGGHSTGKTEGQSAAESVAAPPHGNRGPPPLARDSANQSLADTPTRGKEPTTLPIRGKDPIPPLTPLHSRLPDRLTSTPSYSSDQSQLDAVISDYSILGINDSDVAMPTPSHVGMDWDAVNRQALLELEHASRTHWEAFLRQLLHKEGLNQAWFDVIKPLALEASHTVQPYIFNDAQMDILNYVRVKKVPGGSMIDSALHYGEVFTKSLPFVRMSQMINSPRVMLLKCALEVYRAPKRLTSMEVLLMQEEEYMKHIIARIQSYSPDVIVIEKSAAGLGLDMLLDLGITMVTNVKESVMLRLAHCTEAQLVSSLKGLSLGAECGTCKHFYVKKFTLPSGRKKTLMFFDECQHNRACTVVLRGGSQSELQKVKKVLRFAVFAAYSNLLENRFLWNEFALPLAPPSYKELVEAAQRPAGERGTRGCVYPCLPTLAVEASDSGALEDKGKQDAEEGRQSLDMEMSMFTKVSSASELNREALIYTDINCDHSLSPTVRERTVQTKQDVFQKTLSSSLVTISPHITFSVPFLLQEGIKLRHMAMYLPEALCWSEKFAPENDPASEIKGLVAKQRPAAEPGKRRNEPPAARQDSVNVSQHFSPEHVSLQQSADTPLHNRKESTPQRDLTHYTSVTSHPFTRTLFFTSAKSNEVKSVLADFRARAGLKGESQEFFFPSSRQASQSAPVCSSSPHAGSHGNPTKPRRKPIRQSLPQGRDYASDDLRFVRGPSRRHPVDGTKECSLLATGRETKCPAASPIPVHPTTGTDDSAQELIWEQPTEDDAKVKSAAECSLAVLT